MIRVTVASEDHSVTVPVLVQGGGGSVLVREALLLL